MSLARALHEEVMALPAPAWDSRLAGVMDEAAYAQYHSANPGHTYYVYLAKLVALRKPLKVVELGTDLGRASLFMMTQLGLGSRLYTIELGRHEAEDLWIFRHDPRLWRLKGDDLSRWIFDWVMEDNTPIDLLFIDSLHTEEHVGAVFDLWGKAVSSSGLVVLDDIHLDQGMERAWNRLPGEKWDCGLDVHFSGWGLVLPDGRPTS